jgi:hypothetical protein
MDKNINNSQDSAVSVAVVSTKIDSLKELMLEKVAAQDLVLDIIKEQTLKTNGHVADAFREIAGLNAFKNKVVGALIVSNIIVVPIVLFLLYQKLK